MQRLQMMMLIPDFAGFRRTPEVDFFEVRKRLSYLRMGTGKGAG